MKNVFSQGVTLANDYLERPDVLEWEKNNINNKEAYIFCTITLWC